MIAAPEHTKEFSTLAAQAALAGIMVVASRDDRGRRTVILTRGARTLEVPIEKIKETISGELRACGEVA